MCVPSNFILLFLLNVKESHVCVNFPGGLAVKNPPPNVGDLCSILGTCHSGEFLFQCPIFLPFHTVYGVIKARILKWFAIPFSSGPHSVRPLHHDPSILGGPTRHGLVSLS